MSRANAVTVDGGPALYLTEALSGTAPQETLATRPRLAVDESRISGLDTPFHGGSTLPPGR